MYCLVYKFFIICSLTVIISAEYADAFEVNSGISSRSGDFRNLARIVLTEAARTINGFLLDISKFSVKALIEIFSNLVKGIFSPPTTMPVVARDRWWGEHHREDYSIRPFKLCFSDEKLEELRYRLRHRRNFTRPLTGAVHTYGTNTKLLHHLLDYWENGYNFRAREDLLNKLPQYTTNIQGLDIHFIHVKPKSKVKAVPIVLIHGFSTANVYEYKHLIRYLIQERKDRDFVFEIVVPGIPGFGFSQATNKLGMSPYQVGIIFDNLMSRLGYKRYYVHAGDVGTFVAQAMAVLFPTRVCGFHTNFPFSARPETVVKHIVGQLYPSAVVAPKYEDRMYPLIAMLRNVFLNFGYFHMQATRPDNIGHAIEDTPSGLVSYLLELIITETDNRNLLHIDGKLSQHYDIDDFVDSFSVFWFAKSFATSIRLYAEYLSVLQDPLNAVILMTPSSVPYAAIKFRHEVVYQPDSFLRDAYPNLVQSRTLDYGGHFPNFEHADVMADSIWSAVDKMKNWHRDNSTLSSISL